MVDETGNDREEGPNWDDLQGMWQDTPAVDMAKMARSARFVWWRMRVNFVLEIVISVVGLVVFGAFIDFASVPLTLLGVFGLVYCAVAIWAALRIRRGAWDDTSGDAMSLVQLQIRRAKSTILYIKLNSWLGLAALFLIPLAYWVFYERYGSLSHEKLDMAHWVLGAMAIFLLAFPLVTRPVVHKKKQQIEALEAVRAQLLGT